MESGIHPPYLRFSFSSRISSIRPMRVYHHPHRHHPLISLPCFHVVGQRPSYQVEPNTRGSRDSTQIVRYHSYGMWPWVKLTGG